MEIKYRVRRTKYFLLTLYFKEERELPYEKTKTSMEKTVSKQEMSTIFVTLAFIIVGGMVHVHTRNRSIFLVFELIHYKKLRKTSHTQD